MKTYKTTELANIFNIHPNTVRKYEEIGFIPKAERKANGYRIFTELHLEHLKLARKALDVEIIQNGLRKQSILIIVTAKNLEYSKALLLSKQYLINIQKEKTRAEEALIITEQILSKQDVKIKNLEMTRKQTADYLGTSIDSLRSWELNGLITVKRRKNGYRIYTGEDLSVLKIIRMLREANYSLSAILRMLRELSSNKHLDIKSILDTPSESEFIISVCDKLITSLSKAEKNAEEIILIITKLISNHPL